MCGDLVIRANSSIAMTTLRNQTLLKSKFELCKLSKVRRSSSALTIYWLPSTLTSRPLTDSSISDLQSSMIVPFSYKSISRFWKAFQSIPRKPVHSPRSITSQRTTAVSTPSGVTPNQIWVSKTFARFYSKMANLVATLARKLALSTCSYSRTLSLMRTFSI